MIEIEGKMVFEVYSKNDLQSIVNGILYIEEWRPVVGYEGLYEISSFGRVRNCEKVRNNRFADLPILPRIMKQYIPRDEYLCIGLRNNSKKQKTYVVHRLVAIAFHDNPKNKPQVNHINANKLDNFYLNLEWNTLIENMQHAEKLGLVPHPSGSAHALSKAVQQFDLDGNFIKEYPSQRNAAISLGISYVSLNTACNGKLKTSGGFIWKLK